MTVFPFSLASSATLRQNSTVGWIISVTRHDISWNMRETLNSSATPQHLCVWFLLPLRRALLTTSFPRRLFAHNS